MNENGKEKETNNSNSNNQKINSSIDKKIYFNLTKKIQIIEKPYNNNNLGSLCELFLSDLFTIDLLIEYLIKKEDHSSIDLLSNLLFKNEFSSKAFFYLPQLCSLVRGKAYNETIQNYITYKSAEDNMFAVCANWIFTSYIKDLEGNSKLFDKCIEDIEMSLINGVKITEKEYDNQFFMNKSAKLNFFDDTINFYSKLKKICDKLKTLKPGQYINNNNLKNPITLKQTRNLYLRNHLVKINKRINNDKNQKFNLENNPFVGYILPFENYSNKVIIHFIPNYSFCFSTKARVPIKLTFECIDLLELRKKKQLEENETDIERNLITESTENFYSIEDKSFNSEDDSDEKEKKSQTNSEKERTEKIIQQVKYDNEHPELENNLEIENDIQQTIENQTKADDLVKQMENIFGENWLDITNEIKSKSKYKN